MKENIKIAVFGATGKLGDQFVTQALKAGYNLRVLVRNKSKLSHIKHPNIEIIIGDATNSKDVEKVIKGIDVVVSCLGNVHRRVLIMVASFKNILTSSSAQQKIPRCLLITSIGCGGTSWLTKFLLILIMGKAGFNDYETADKLIREESTVPCVLVRPSVLKDKAGSGNFSILQNQNKAFATPIARADVAKFLLKCIGETKWDRKSILLTGKKKK